MTRILVISDIHANLPALEAVLQDAGQVDETWCLGDVVGYGPDPNECILRLGELQNLTCLMGNHDLAAVGGMVLDVFNHDARNSLLWQKRVLTSESLEFLRNFPQVLQIRGEGSLVHGSPRDPIWEYVLNTSVAFENLAHFFTPWCFLGHTHFQSVFQYHTDSQRMEIQLPKPGDVYEMKERAILNPGSVGQPRDRDTRAAYAIFESEEKMWHPKRVKYDIKEVQERILKAGLPARHANRLLSGW